MYVTLEFRIEITHKKTMSEVLARLLFNINFFKQHGMQFGVVLSIY